jgi:uncharacterized protein YbaP (TraB family)
MLYELEGTRLRVLGTLHLLPPGGKLPDWLVSAYEWSEAVFIEHSPTDFLLQARQATGPLESRVSPAFWQLLQRLTLEAGVVLPLAEFQRGAAVVMAMGCRIQGIAGADQALHDWCQRDHKVFGYVEQPAAVLQALEEISEDEWTQAIHAELARPESPASQLKQVYGAWLGGETQTLEAGTREGLFAVEKVRSALLTRRNRCWASAYANPPHRSLVAVGAAHLVGDNSFLDELTRVSGCAVRRVA